MSFYPGFNPKTTYAFFYFTLIALVLLCVPYVRSETSGSYGYAGNLPNSYGYVYVDSWVNGRWTEELHLLSISNGEDFDITYTWEVHHEIVGWGHDPNGIYVDGGWGPTVFPGGYSYIRRSPYVATDYIRDFPEGATDVTIHSCTGLEAYDTKRPWRRDSWQVQRNHTVTVN